MGGYAENTALPMTLAKAQRDCKAGVTSCDRPIHAILVNDGNSSAMTTGFGPFTAEDPLRSLFTDPARPSSEWVPGMFGTVHVPKQTVFTEQFPATNQWKPYHQFPVTKLFPGSKVKENIISHFWNGIVTTVDNLFYGTTAGQKVNLLVFSLDIPGVAWPSLFDPQAVQATSPGFARICGGVAEVDKKAVSGHAPMAKSQAAAFLPILTEFLNFEEVNFV